MAYTPINKSTEHFNTKLYTGNGSAGHAITGVGFKPDLLWIKPRNLANSNRLHSPLLTAPDYFVMSENTDVEATNNDCVTSFDTDGFTLGNTDNGWNGSYNYVSWNWKAAGTSGSSNSDGSITSTVSANTTSGFSIVNYTGSGANATVGHGLGAAPKAILFKNKNTATDWDVYHGSMAATERIHLNTTAAKNTAAQAFNSTAPTSSVFSVGTADNTNKSSSPMIAFCFAEKTGFSKMGLYYGNSDNNGPFVYTGFKPAFLMLKETGSTSAWFIIDNRRTSNGGNPHNLFLRPNDYAAETNSSWHKIDFVSNGFKIKDDDADINDASYNYIYMAFAEAPLVGSNDAPANAG
jgi:hypothetical protein